MVSCEILCTTFEHRSKAMSELQGDVTKEDVGSSLNIVFNMLSQRIMGQESRSSSSAADDNNDPPSCGGEITITLFLPKATFLLSTWKHLEEMLRSHIPTSHPIRPRRRAHCRLASLPSRFAVCLCGGKKRLSETDRAFQTVFSPVRQDRAESGDSA